MVWYCQGEILVAFEALEFYTSVKNFFHYAKARRDVNQNYELLNHIEESVLNGFKYSLTISPVYTTETEFLQLFS